MQDLTIQRYTTQLWETYREFVARIDATEGITELALLAITIEKRDWADEERGLKNILLQLVDDRYAFLEEVDLI